MEQVKNYLDLYFKITDPDVVSSIYYEIMENPANYLYLLYRLSGNPHPWNGRPDRHLAQITPSWNLTAFFWIWGRRLWGNPDVFCEVAGEVNYMYAKQCKTFY